MYTLNATKDSCADISDDLICYSVEPHQPPGQGLSASVSRPPRVTHQSPSCTFLGFAAYSGPVGHHRSGSVSPNEITDQNVAASDVKTDDLKNIGIDDLENYCPELANVYDSVNTCAISNNEDKLSVESPVPVQHGGDQQSAVDKAASRWLQGHVQPSSFPLKFRNFAHYLHVKEAVVKALSVSKLFAGDNMSNNTSRLSVVNNKETEDSDTLSARSTSDTDEDGEDGDDIEETTICSQCGLRLRNAASLSRHMATHRREADGSGKENSCVYTCSDCDSVFFNIMSLNRHASSCEGIVGGTDSTTKRCRGRDKPDKKLPVNRGLIKFECDKCEFKTPNGGIIITQHIALHNPISNAGKMKKFSCDTCKMYFSSKTHSRTHQYKYHSNGLA